MIKVKVKLKTVRQVKDFSNMATQCPFTIELMYGFIAADAKSVMEILKLPLVNEVTCIIHTTKEKGSKFLQSIAGMVNA